ncbi:PREDICTED: A-kinase anchor protein 12-like isoform X2 [Cyprinodon variegatus]|uniref:A-kinase anchor protein 12-like isoform X2 n=1 Tax=Cyprinodon variegatus TaxID=28743 RepID=UPI0007427DA7|nr:PREDICTED: A-kinase anchor protein 12-like isoform X2 [Cyprinodon variegatus]
MGDAQSAQREAKGDAAAEEEESGEVKDVQDVDNKVLQKNGQISDISKKAESSISELNGNCEDIEAAICPEINITEAVEDKETPLENEIDLKDVAKDTEDELVEQEDVIEMDAKQNDINESFRKFFSNIGLKLTVKRGSTDKGGVPIDMSEEEPSKPEDIKGEDAANKINKDDEEQTELITAEEAVENDSTVCQTLTDDTPDDFQEKEGEKTAETNEERISHETSPLLNEDTTPQEEPQPPSPTGLDETASPFKKFFTTGIFSGLRKKKKLEDEEVGEKELVEGEVNVTQAGNDELHDEDVTPVLDAKEENLITKSAEVQEEAKAPLIVVDEITNSQEIVQESPLKRLLSGSSFKKRSKKQKGRKSSDAKLSDSGEHVSDQHLSSVESAENKKDETSAQTSAEAVSGEDGAWFSFKKLVTPQRRKKSSVDHVEEPIQGSKDGEKSVEGEQISDQSTEEGKRRKDSSVSWEAVLCGSGRRRSRKTSDSEDETPQLDGEENRQNDRSKEAGSRASTEVQEVLASPPKETEGPPEGDESSTWKSFKKLVTPKRKSKDEGERISEIDQEDSSFSIIRLLSGRKTRKSVDVSPEEVSKEIASVCDEDSETPAVVPLSEFDLTETQTMAEKDADNTHQMDINEIKEEVQSKDTVQVQANDIPDNEGALEKEASSAVATNEEHNELTESSEHQHLSDIPEEGVLTENTPASEEAAKDETIAEDLLEITSEAITAPEPADVTLADETEMVSALSQLSESSKTSGNTTPVPAEYSVLNTETLLQQVSETITVSPKAVPVFLEEPNPERVVCLASNQILESSVLEKPKILEIHRESDAASIKTGLNAEEIDAVNEVTATAQAESISHLNEAILTEISSEVPKELLDTAKPAADEVYEVNISELQKDIKDMQIVEERQHAVEDTGDVDEEASSESLPKGEDAGTEDVLTDQTEQDSRKTHSEEEELAVPSADDLEEAYEKEEEQPATELDTETKQMPFEQAQNEALSSAAVDELEKQAGAEKVELPNVERDIQSHEERSAEDTEPSEILSQDLTEVTKTNTEPQIAGAETDISPPIQLEEDMLETPNKEVDLISENILTTEKDTDESTQVVTLPEMTKEAAKKEPENDLSEVTVSLENVQAPTLESEEDITEPPNREVLLSDGPAFETEAEESRQVDSLIEEAKEEERKESLIAADQVGSSEVTDVSEIMQDPATETDENVVQSLLEDVSLPDMSSGETHTEESKPPEPLTEVREEQDDKEPRIGEVQIDQLEITEVFQTVEVPTLESQNTSALSPDEELLLFDISQAKTGESKQVESLTEVPDEQEDKETKADAAETEESKHEELVTEVPDEPQDKETKADAAETEESKHVELVTEVPDEPEDKETKADAAETEEPKHEEFVTEVPDEPEDKETKADAAETEESKQVELVTEVPDEPEEETKADAAQTENAELAEEFKSVKSDEDVIQSLIKDTEMDNQEEKQEVTNKIKGINPQTDADQINQVKEEISSQAPIINLEEDAVKSIDKEALSPENILAGVTNYKELELAKSLPEAQEEQDNKELQTTITALESSEVAHVSEIKDAIDVAQDAILESEGSRVEILEKDITPYETVPKAETAEETPKTQTLDVQAEDTPETEQALEPEPSLAPPLDPAEISCEACDTDVIYDTPVVEKVTDELIITDLKEPLCEKLEGSLSDAQDITSDLDTSQQTTAPNEEESTTEKVELQTMLQDVPQPEDIDIAKEEPEGNVAQQLDQETDAEPCDAKVKDEENVLEDLQGLQAPTAVHISSVDESPGSAEVLEKTTSLEENLPDCIDTAEVSEESRNEVNLCEQQERVEGEEVDLLSDAEIKVAATVSNVISHEVMSNLKEVSTEKPSAVVCEALTAKMVSESEFIDTVETTAPLVLDEINQAAEPSSAVLKMNVPPVEIEVNHKVQVHLMDVEIRSAEKMVDTVIQVGVTEVKGTIDVCQENIQEVENISATAGIEEGVAYEGIQVTVQDVMQHITSNLPESASDSASENEEKDIELKEIIQKVCETDQKELVQTEEDTLIIDSTEMVNEGQEEEALTVTENSGIPVEQLEESKLLSSSPQSSEVSIKDHKEDLKEAKPAEPEIITAVGDVRAEVLAVKDPNESPMEPLPTTHTQVATAGTAGLAVPQNTGVISSAGNLESPSSLSLEFKLNIQFAQAKTQTWPSAAPTERPEPVRQVDVFDAGVQAEESVPKGDECKKQTELNEVAVQAVSVTEADPETHLNQRALIASQPVLQDVGIQAVERTEWYEQIQSTERATTKVQAVDVQSSRQEKRAVLLSKPLLSELKKGWAFRQSEDENDVWLDAEEDIYPQHVPQTTIDQVDEHIQLQSESEQKEEAEPEMEFEMASSLETEDTESQQSKRKKETGAIESEGEDFDVALEELGSSVPAVE